MAILQDLKNGLNKSKQVFAKIANTAYQNPTLRKISKFSEKVTNSSIVNAVARPYADILSNARDTTQSTARTFVGAGLAIRDKESFTPKSFVSKALVGSKPVPRFEKQVSEQADQFEKLGLNRKAALPLAFGIGALDIVSPLPFDPGDFAKAGLKNLAKEDVELLIKSLGDDAVEKIVKGKAGKKLLEEAQDLIKKNKSITEGIVSDAITTLSPADAADYTSAGSKELTSLVGNQSSKVIGEPLVNPKPKSLIDRELQLAKRAEISKAVDSGFIQENISSLVEEGAPKDPVKTLTSALKEAAVKRKEQEAIYTATRGKRFSEGYAARSGGGIEGFVGAKTAMSGEMEKVTMEALSKSLDQPTINGLFDKIAKSDLDQGDYLNAGEGLKNLLEGSVPTESQLKLLNDLFPSDLVSNLINNKSAVKKFMEGAGEVVNIPRALMASFDMSAPFRQGVFMTSRPKQFLPAMRDMFKYAFSPKAYEELIQDIKSRPTYGLMEASNLSITDLGKLSNREETFMSNLAERLPIVGPVVKSGNRSYSGFLNKLRADVFDDLVKKGTELGVDFNGKAGQDLAKFINSATGRGDIGKLGDAAPLINGLFFSPRLMKSRIDLLNPTFYAKLDPFVRKEALKSLFTFAGTGLTILGLAKMGGAEVEDDPRSADFGKIKTGNTRYDIWGGFQQYIKLAAQLTTGELKSSTTGEIYKTGVGYKPITRLDLVYRFLEQKESPVPSFVTGLLKGKTATGEEFEVSKEVIDRVIPLILQDLKDVYQESGSAGLGKQIPAFFGIGTQTYSDVSRKGAKPFSSSTVKVAKPKPKVTPKPKPTPKY